MTFPFNGVLKKVVMCPGAEVGACDVAFVLGPAQQQDVVTTITGTAFGYAFARLTTPPGVTDAAPAVIPHAAVEIEVNVPIKKDLTVISALNLGAGLPEVRLYVDIS